MGLSFTKNCKRQNFLILFFLAATLTPFFSTAQQLDIRDFVLFGGNGSCPGAGQTTPATPGCSVVIGTSTNVTNGKVGSYKLVKTVGNTQMTASIHSGGRIELGNSNNITGNITAAANSGTVFSTGSNATIQGSVHVNGNSSVGGGSISGQVVHPAGTTYSGPVPGGGEVVGTPTLPGLPALPAIAVFAAAGSTHITSTQTINPNNTFGAVTLDGSKRLTFSGTGTYVFSRIKLSGSSNKFIFDFKNNTTDIFRLQVHGDVDLDKINVEFLNGGSSSRIYLEVHGNGSTSASGKNAWTIANGSSGSNGTIWYGSVWAPYATINVGSGSNPPKVEGSLWSGTQVNLSSGVSVTYSRLTAFCNTPIITTTTATGFCEGGNVVLTSSSISGNQWHKNGVVITGATAKTYTATTPGSYTVSVDGDCSSTPVNVSVTALPVISGNAPVCVGSGVQLSATGTPAASNPWTSANIAIATVSSTGLVTGVAAGSANITFANSAGCKQTVSITVNALPPTPAISTTNPTTICSGGTVLLTSSAASGNQWYKNGTVITGATAANFSATEGGTYSVKATVNGCTSPASNAITVTFLNPPLPVADGGTNQSIVCPTTTQATIGTTNSVGSEFKWTVTLDGVETIVGTQNIITVTKAGTYTLTVKNSCGVTATDDVVVTYVSCVVPISVTDDDKVDDLIGHELTYLTTNLEEAKKSLIILGPNQDTVLIEAVAVIGQETAATSFLVGLGLTNIIPNGLNYQIVSGRFPINKLLIINSRPDLINHCRPIFMPLGNVGVVTSAGDTSIAANLARGGFTIGGAGIKIGVISDSYNTLANNPAQKDIDNGDLPGVGNPDGNNTPVDLLLDYPYGRRSDEGRGMLQIIHDVAPQASLAFRTGFISAGDFAQGIIQLKDAGCKIICDDVTYITEPFFQDGVVSRAVNDVDAAGVSYFTSAGNFGSRSYQSTYTPAPIAGTFAVSAHDFGGGDIYQKLKLKSGNYTIVMQWQDNIYSLAQSVGTVNDMDIYLIDAGGRTGFNRNNLGGDPLEVMSFSINLPDTSQVIEADLLITKDNPGGTNPLVKYILFRGNAVIDEYYSGQPLVNKSTIVGHANSAHAIAVGAVLYSNTPAFGNPASIASFSSTGGTPVTEGATTVTRPKPELTGPNGVNTSTTIPLGPDNDGYGNTDGFPNFYGTSAAAPHAAAATALVLEARQKYYGVGLTPSALKTILLNSALPMQPDGIVNGVNYKAGNGLVQPDGAIRSFANPTPKIITMVYNPGIIPGTITFTLKVEGNYLTTTSLIYFRGQPLTTTWISPSELQATVPLFTGNPAIHVYTPPFPGTNGTDGGPSDSLYFFSTKRDTVTIVADNKTKKYGEALPVLSTTILVNGDSLHVYNAKKGTNLTRADLGVANPTIRYTNPTLNALSDVGIYQIRASRTFDPLNQTDIGLLEKYYYDSTFGNLQITKLQVTLSPRDTTIVYGEPLDNFNFNYILDPSANIADPTAVTNIVKASHEQYVDNTVLGVINNNEGGGAVVIFNGRLLNVIENASVIINGKLLPVVTSSIDGGAVVIFNGVELEVENSVSGGGAVVIFNGEEFSVENGGGAVVIFNGQILPVVSSAVDGGAVVIFNGVEYEVEASISGGGAVVIFNGEEVPVLNGEGGAVVIFNGQYYPVVKNSEGGAVVIFNGEQLPVQNTADGGAVVIFNGEEVSVSDGGSGAVVIFNGEMLPVEVDGIAGGGGAVVIFNGNRVEVPYLNGEGGGAVVIFNGQILPVVASSIDGGAVVIFNNIEYDVSIDGGGGAVVIFNNETVPVVNSVSAATLTNMSLLASTNAIANARTVGGQTNKFIDVSANAFANFNTTTNSARLINAYPFTNARGLVEANELAGGGAVTIFNSDGGGAVVIFNGSGGYVNTNTVPGSSVNKTPVIIDEADVNSASNPGGTIEMLGINMITGITAGEQTFIPAALLNPNINVTYDLGTVTITKAPVTVKARDTTKLYADALSLNPAAFSITAGTMKYGEKLSFVSLTSNGAPASANVGNYSIVASNAVGAYGTDVSNYNLSYQNGNLAVTVNPCPVITHSKASGFTSTDKNPTSIWLNIQLKVRGDLMNAGDYIAFKGGRITLENVTSETPVVDAVIPNGKIMAANVTQPTTRFDVASGSFITLVPLGFSSTSEVFITGAVFHSKTGFTKKNNPGSVVKGIFQSNVPFDDQWNYGMAAYKAITGAVNTPPQYVQLANLSGAGSVVSIHDSYKAGTPLPWLSRITAGGTGNGGTNYTGSPSSNDNFTACQLGAASSPAVTAKQRTPQEVEEKTQLTGLQIFPNPAATSVTISFVASVKGSASIGIYSLNGVKVNEVYTGTADAGKLYTRQINTANLANGMYIIRLQEKGKVVTKKLIINRQ